MQREDTGESHCGEDGEREKCSMEEMARKVYEQRGMNTGETKTKHSRIKPFHPPFFRSSTSACHP